MHLHSRASYSVLLWEYVLLKDSLSGREEVQLGLVGLHQIKTKTKCECVCMCLVCATHVYEMSYHRFVL